MRKHEIENWALSVVDRVRAAQPVEDVRVELKAAWPETPHKAARRVAAHANAARGDLILWLIGVDESAGVTGASQVEMADWWAQVQAQFDGLAPGVIDIDVPADGQTVVALLFETDRAPYVVKTQNAAGGVTLEVPWRDGTRVRSARRDELLRILSPLQALPVVEVLGGEFREGGPHHSEKGVWVFKLKLYVVPRTATLTIPFHKCTGSIKFEVADAAAVSLEQIELNVPKVILPGKPGMSPSTTVRASDYEVIMDGPGLLELTAKSRPPENPNSIRLSKARVVLELLPTDAERPVVVVEELAPADPGAGRTAWRVNR